MSEIIRIMTNNVWNCDKNRDAWIEKGEDCSAVSRGPDIAKVYILNKPDIVNFQEMTPLMMSILLEKTKEAGQNYVQVTTYPNTVDYTPLVYNADKLKLIDCHHHIFDYGSDVNSKGYQWGLFESTETGKRFVDITTHLWWKSEAMLEGSDDIRRRQAVEIAVASEELIEKYGVPVILQGDMNMRISAPGYKDLLDAGFVDCHDIALEADNTRGYHSCSPQGYTTELSPGDYSAAIDHSMIINGGSCTVLSFRQLVYDFYWRLSDHMPLYIDVDFG